jgi:hypothetical protein
MSRTIINITGYTVDDNINSSDDLFNLASGSTFVLLGENVLSDDAIDGPGTVRVRGATTIDDSLLLSGAALFANLSGLTQNGAAVEVGQSAADSVTARNLADATWTLLNGAGITSAGGSEFVNLGLFHQATGVSTIDANFVDRGGVIEADGTLIFASPGDVNRFVNDKIEGAGSFDLGDLAVLDGSSISTLTTSLDNVRILGNVHVSSQNAEVDDLNLRAGAVLTLANSAGNYTFGDKIDGAGTIAIRGGNPTFARVSLVGGVTFANYGDTQFEHVVDFTTTPFAGDTVTIENEAGAVWSDESYNGSVFTSDDAAGTAVFVNNGTFTENSYNGVIFGIPVVNNGIMGPNAFSFNVGTDFALISVTGTGTVDIGAYHVIVGTVGSGQTFDFDPALAVNQTPTLDITDPQGFAGTITGFDQGGVTDDQLVVNTATWTYEDFVPNGGGTGGALMFSNGAAETAINLTGSYTASGFHAAVNGATTTITYTG